MFSKNILEDDYQMVVSVAQSHTKDIVAMAISELKVMPGLNSQSCWNDLCDVMKDINRNENLENYLSAINTIIHKKLSDASVESRSTIWQLTVDGKKWYFENPTKTFLDVFTHKMYSEKKIVHFLKIKVIDEASKAAGRYLQ